MDGDGYQREHCVNPRNTPLFVGVEGILTPPWLLNLCSCSVIPNVTIWQPQRKTTNSKCVSSVKHNKNMNSQKSTRITITTRVIHTIALPLEEHWKLRRHREREWKNFWEHRENEKIKCFGAYLKFSSVVFLLPLLVFIIHFISIVLFMFGWMDGWFPPSQHPSYDQVFWFDVVIIVAAPAASALIPDDVRWFSALLLFFIFI